MYFSTRALLAVTAGLSAVGSVAAAPERHEKEIHPPHFPGIPGRPHPHHPGHGHGTSSEEPIGTLTTQTLNPPTSTVQPIGTLTTLTLNPPTTTIHPIGTLSSTITSNPISTIQPIGTLSTITSSASIPASCWTTWDDFEHTTGGVSVNCFTYTSTTVPGTDKCPPCTGPALPCPFIIRETTSNVPCATDCCPTTATKYVDGPCPSCGVCNIPTQTRIVTTGCPTTAPIATPATPMPPVTM